MSKPIFNTVGLANDPEGRERWWDPADPRIFVPRAIGLGWDINFGAIAVKLGWIREDDLDDHVIAAIPERFTAAAETAVGISAGLAMGANFYNLSQTGDRRAAMDNVIGAGLVTVFAATRKQPADRLITGALATAINTAVGLKSLEGVVTAPGIKRALKFGQVTAIIGIPLGIVTSGIKLGLARVASP